MKRYHYKSAPADTQSKQSKPWIIPVALGSALLGLIAFASIGIASSSPKSTEEPTAARAEQRPVEVSDQELGQPLSEPSMVPGQISETFDHCGMVRRTCVVDGDTFWLNGEKIRIADIDTPEISQPQCAYEKQLGLQATDRLIGLLNAGPFELHTIGERDTDQYGRMLRVVVRDGKSLGDQLVSEGLARTWTGRREPWC